MRKITILLYIILCACINSFSQQFITHHYTNKDYKGEQKIWDAKEDNYGRIWFANNEGIIRFDGNNWTLYRTPTAARHLAFSKSGDLYIACLGDFGILEFKQDGSAAYSSLLNQNSLSDKKTGGDENVFIAGDDIYFYMRKHLVTVKKSGNEYQTLVLPNAGEYAGAFTDDKYLYVNVIGKGLGIIQHGNFSPYKTAIGLEKYDIIGGMLTTKGLTILSNYNGIFNFKDNLSAGQTSSLNSFAKKGTTAFCKFKNQQYVIGTLHDGVKIFGNDGSEIYLSLIHI